MMGDLDVVATLLAAIEAEEAHGLAVVGPVRGTSDRATHWRAGARRLDDDGAPTGAGLTAVVKTTPLRPRYEDPPSAEALAPPAHAEVARALLTQAHAVAVQRRDALSAAIAQAEALLAAESR